MHLTEEEYAALVARRQIPTHAFATLPPMTEAQLQRQVMAVAARLGYLSYHTYSSKRSAPGYPDVTLVHPAGGTLFLLELKRDTEHPTLAQQRWLDALGWVTRVESGVVQPRSLADWVRRLQAHADFHRGRVAPWTP